MSIIALNKIQRLVPVSLIKYRNVKHYSEEKEEERKEKKDLEIPQNLLKEFYSANQQTHNGVIYDTKPFKYTCEAGKVYAWCLCGQSHAQPFCDGTHRNPYLKITQRPIKFQVKETKDYWLCNCKQTSNRPFCDGTHTREDITLKKHQK